MTVIFQQVSNATDSLLLHYRLSWVSVSLRAKENKISWRISVSCLNNICNFIKSVLLPSSWLAILLLCIVLTIISLPVVPVSSSSFLLISNFKNSVWFTTFVFFKFKRQVFFLYFLNVCFWGAVLLVYIPIGTLVS